MIMLGNSEDFESLVVKKKKMFIIQIFCAMEWLAKISV